VPDSRLFLLVIRPPREPDWSRKLDLLVRELGGERLGEGVFTVSERDVVLARLRTLVAQFRCGGGDALIARGNQVETGDGLESDARRPADS
jgi:hypothetical protein